MNLTGRPVYQKGQRRRSRGKARPANAEERRHWEKVRALGCLLEHTVFEGGFECEGPIAIHHCFTGAGGRKDHMKVIPLCHEHHQGAKGIDGQRMSKKKWQEKYGTEAVLLKRVQRRLK